MTRVPVPIAAFGSRPLSTVVRSVAEPRHYLALYNILRRFREPFEVLRRYLTRSGTYPWTAVVQTPTGSVNATLFHPEDIRTLVEIFGRLDYAAPDDVAVTVDVGANIGISALYFLSRNDRSYCHLFEPDPRNLTKLRQNLEPFAGRFVLHEEAVSTTSGIVSFGTEESGRYGGIGLPLSDTIEVSARDINEVLDEIVETNGTVDVLKVDTEGTEVSIVAAIRPELATQIKLIYLEDPHVATPLHPSLFRASRRGYCVRLKRRIAD